MAERLPTFDFTKPSELTKSNKPTYPWDSWLDGNIWKLSEGDDFHTHPLMMERIIRTRATARRAKIRMRHLPGANDSPFGVIVLQRTDAAPTDAADTQAIGAPRCPVCTSDEVLRHAEGFGVWFTCNCCGAVFGK